MPATIEDHNGNIVVVKDNRGGNFTFTDTAGRVAVSSSGIGPSGATNTLSFSGLSFQVKWETVSPSFTAPSTQVNALPGVQCSAPPARSGSITTVSQITLPTGAAYYFQYGNSYGLPSEIDYPDGGWVKYTWKLSDTMNELADYPGLYPPSESVTDGCQYQYKTPVLATRQVGFGGSAPSLTQTFTYSTTWSASKPATWTQKNTTVCTTDDVRGSTVCTTPTSVPSDAFLTQYSYTPVYTGLNSPFANSDYFPQVPVEALTSYYNWGSSSSSSPLKTVAKTWNSPFELASQTTTIGTLNSSLVTYTYAGFSQPLETDEYDYGASTPSRKTINFYQSFTAAPGYLNYLQDKPCKTIVTDGAATRFPRQTITMTAALLFAVLRLLLGNRGERVRLPARMT